MGVPVTVDSDHLETLLFATAAIKGVEAALQAQKKDPLFEKAKGHYTEVSDYLARAWRDATRRRDMPQLFRDPTPEEVAQLYAIFHAPHEPDHICRLAIEWAGPKHHRSLVSIGLVELGNERDQIIWSDGSITSVPKPPRVFARLTSRGVKVLEHPWSLSDAASAEADE